MELEIAIHPEQKYIEATTRGVLDKDSSMDMAKTITKTMRHHKIRRALIDHRNAANIPGQVIDVYDRPKIFRLIGVLLGIKVAEIINPEHTEHFKFLETVCLNQGFRFSIFYDKTSALEWLLK